MAHRAPPQVRRPRWLGWIPVALLVVGAILLIVNYWPSSGPPPTSDLLPRAQGPSLTVSHPPSTRATPSPEVPSVRPVVVVITATAPCWILLTEAGGKTVYEGTVQPGFPMMWGIQPPGSLRLGYPAGVTVTVNGVVDHPGPGAPVTMPITQGN